MKPNGKLRMALMLALFLIVISGAQDKVAKFVDWLKVDGVQGRRALTIWLEFIRAWCTQAERSV
jgi:hypothetical protein